ncbi:MAG: hypothetical protein ABS46_07505 [Cytophagaceae bacterium SCN 52-12]|nr:MAG: hypothetical protein ABS46_07505 [Cytophagaceae bacterium SCN 52-12]
MLDWFKKTAFWEGVSYLVLLFIAMPLKYFFDSPAMVRYVGMAHGVLFITYVLLLVWNWSARKWDFGKAAVYFLASLLPFATFWVERKVAAEQAAAGI